MSVKIENWSTCTRKRTPYESPEIHGMGLHGNIYGHPLHDDGKIVTTSRIVGKRSGLVVTKSGSEYELGKIDAEYDKQFPNALNRLMETLPEV